MKITHATFLIGLNDKQHVIILLVCCGVDNIFLSRINYPSRRKSLCRFSVPFDHPSALAIAAQTPPLITDHARMNASRIVIQGVMLNGRAFRPSDWAERLCGIMSTFGGDQQMRYSPFVRPMMLDGVRCVLVEPSLATSEPRAYRFLLDFAKDNELIVIDPNAPTPEDFCPVPGSVMESLSG